MKRIFALLLAMLMALSGTACSAKDENKPSTKHQAIILPAIQKLETHWKDHYQEEAIGDGYFEIKNTRVITLKANDIEMFQDVAYIIEFELFTDLFGSAPYYMNTTYNNNVVVYKNGTMAVATNMINKYRSYTYNTDYSGFMESIDDYKGQYNSSKYLK